MTDLPTIPNPSGVASLLLHHTGRNPIGVPQLIHHDKHDSWGIALVIDGWYSSEEMAAGALELWIKDHQRAVAELTASPWIDPAS